MPLTFSEGIDKLVKDGGEKMDRAILEMRRGALEGVFSLGRLPHGAAQDDVRKFAYKVFTGEER